MPRTGRKKSESGIYHIIVRGINRQDIFHENEDFKRYLDTLKKSNNISGNKIYAYCLMSNHIHLLVYEDKEDIGVLMKRIGSSYVYWYNKKYERIGHLFQDRYISENVENDSYIITVFRYIHQNPVKAGIVKEIDNYRFSSWHEYLDDNCEFNIVEKDFIIDVFDSKKELQRYVSEKNEDICMEAWDIKRKSDAEVISLIKKMINNNPIEIQNLKRDERNKILRFLKDSEGISIRQVERITGIGRGVIFKA